MHIFTKLLKGYMKMYLITNTVAFHLCMEFGKYVNLPIDNLGTKIHNSVQIQNESFSQLTISTCYIIRFQ